MGWVTARYGATVAQFRTAAMEKREKALLDEAVRLSSTAAEKRLGVLYAQFGLPDMARERFSRALAGGTTFRRSSTPRECYP